MRVLFFSPRPCYPADTGAKLREYHLLRQLSRCMQVDLLAFETAGPFELPFCGLVKTVLRPKRYTPGKLLKGLVSPLPVSVWNYYSPEMVAALKEVLSGSKYDVIVLESIHMAGYRKELAEWGNGALLVYDWHNIESELMERFVAQKGPLLKRIYALETARRLRRLEKKIGSSGAMHIVCSGREKKKIEGWIGPGELEVVANGMDVEGITAATGLTAERNRILFVGSMDYHPNVAGATFFARRIWPEIWRQKPELTFTIVGSRPTAAVLELGKLGGVEVTGTVESVAPFYREAALVVVPLFEGGGTRLKVVEAMAAGVPVVSTELGAEGISARDGEDLILLGPEGDWAGAVTGLLEDEARWLRIGGNGRRLAETSYDWKLIGEKFSQVLSKWVGRSE